MNFEEFEHLARLHMAGSLDAEEERHFEQARHEFGEKAEAFITECSRLNAVIALSLPPHPPRPETKEKLLSTIRKALAEGGDSQ